MKLLRTFAAKLASATGLPLAAWARPSILAEPRSVSATITASGIQSALRAAEGGDTRPLFAIYRDITVDSHVQAELQKRKLAVICEPWQLLPNDASDPDDVAAAAACDTMISRCANWSDGLAAQLDGVLWPLAVCEKIYRPGTAGLRYELEKLVPVNPATFCFRPPLGAATPAPPRPFEPDLWFYPVDSAGNLTWSAASAVPADPERHWVYRGHLMQGLRDNWGGPLRGLVFWWLLRAKGREWFAALLQSYGKPYPVAAVDAEDKAGIAMLEAAFAPDSQIHGLIVSTSTRVELKECALSGAADAHERFANLCNREISLLIIGQTLSSQAQPTGMGSGTAELQASVRADLRAWDQMKLGESIRQNVFAPFLRLNGLAGRPPRIVWGGVSREKVAATAAVLLQLSQAGLEPTDAALPGLSETLGFELQRKAPTAPGFGAPAAFSATALPVRFSDPTERLVRDHGAALARAYRGALAPFRAAILSSTSREECLATLKTLYADWPAERLAEELDRALQLAAAEGAAAAAKQ